MHNTIEIIPHVFADALSKYLKAQYDPSLDGVLDIHQLRRLINLFLTKHD